MKRILFLSVLFVALLTGCDQIAELKNDTQDAAVNAPLSKQELVIMASQVSSELGLTARTASAVTSAFTSQGDKTPGALWETAKKLQATLTASQKDSLLNPTVDPSSSHPIHVPKGLGGSDGRAAKVPFDILTTDQQTKVKEINTKYHDLIKAIKDDTALTATDKATKIAALHTAKQAEITALLTEEQKAEMAARLEEAKAKFAEAMAADKVVRDQVLAIDAATSTKLDAIYTARKDAATALFDKYKAGTLTAEVLISEVQKLKDAFNTSVKALLSATNAEIVLIHEALHHRRPRGMSHQGGKHDKNGKQTSKPTGKGGH